MIIKFKDLAIFAFPFDAQQDFALGVGGFPARPLSITVGRAVGIDIPRTIEHDPTGLFPFPEV